MMCKTDECAEKSKGLWVDVYLQLHQNERESFNGNVSLKVYRRWKNKPGAMRTMGGRIFHEEQQVSCLY